MSTSRVDADYLYYLIYGSGYIDRPWEWVLGSNDYFNDRFELFVRPTPTLGDVGLVDMSNELSSAIAVVETQSFAYSGDGSLVYSIDAGVPDYRYADRLTLDHKGVGGTEPYHLALVGVEHIDAPVASETHLHFITKDGFVTDGTLKSIEADVGHHDMTFTGAALDSKIRLGAGYDTIEFKDHLDVPGEQFWAPIRRADGELDVYSLFSGYRVRLSDGYKGWTAAPV